MLTPSMQQELALEKQALAEQAAKDAATQRAALELVQQRRLEELATAEEARKLEMETAFKQRMEVCPHKWSFKPSPPPPRHWLICRSLQRSFDARVRRPRQQRAWRCRTRWR